MATQKVIDFTPPETLLDQIGNVPQGTRLELMTNYAVKPDGRWCIVNIEGVPMPGYDSEGNPIGKNDDYPKGGQFVNNVMQGMKGGY